MSSPYRPMVERDIEREGEEGKKVLNYLFSPPLASSTSSQLVVRQTDSRVIISTQWGRCPRLEKSLLTQLGTTFRLLFPLTCAIVLSAQLDQSEPFISTAVVGHGEHAITPRRLRARYGAKRKLHGKCRDNCWKSCKQV